MRKIRKLGRGSKAYYLEANFIVLKNALTMRKNQS